MYVIAIAGGSASGKSTFTERLLKELEGIKTEVIHMDSFFKKKEERPYVKSHINGEYYVDDNCPDTIYFDEYRKRFNELRESGAQVLITEGLLTLWDEETRDKIDMKIFVDCRSDERLIRRVNRNMKWGLKFEEITDVFLNMVRFRHDQYVEPTKWTADFIINGSQKTDMILEMVVEKVKRSI